MPVWEDVVPEEDRLRMARADHGETVGLGSNVALLVVDVTHDFVDPHSPLGAGDMGGPTVSAIRTLLDRVREMGLPVYFTVGTVPETHEERGRRKGIGPSYDGNRIVEQVRPLENERVIPKPKPSAFFSTPLVSWLVYRQIDTLLITGLVTSGCIRATVVDAYSYNFRVILPEECVGDRSTISHKVNLFDMHMKYADVMPLSAVLHELQELANSPTRRSAKPETQSDLGSQS